MAEQIMRSEEFAELLGCTPKALRQRVARGQVPPPFRLGRTLAWLRDPVLEWLRDCSRSAGPAAMKITLRPYANDPSRWHVDIRLMHPTAATEIRKRLVAPAGLSESQARAWADRQVPGLLGTAMSGVAPSPRAKHPEAHHPHPAPLPSPRAARRPAADPPTHRPPPSPTLARFYAERFEPEYVRLQKAATQVSYDSIYRNHIAPRLGALPIAAIDEDRLSSFRAALRRDLDVGTTNLVLSKVGRILRFAKKIRLLDTLPEIEKLALPRARPKRVLDDDEVARLLAAAASEGPVTELIVLLALDAGLRSGEICALEWADVDLRRGAILIQNNTYRGRKQTPKGTIGKIALTDALWRALAEHRERDPAAGPLVLYRRSFRTRGEWRPHTAVTLRDALNAAQERAGLPKTGPHLLRHTALTRLANLGASVFMVQAVARHSRLQTTQTYLHTQQCDLAREAATLLNQAARHPAAAPGFGKVLAKPAPPPENTVPGPARPRN